MDVPLDRHHQRRLAQAQRQELSHVIQETKKDPIRTNVPVFGRPEPCQQDTTGYRISELFGDLQYVKRSHRTSSQSHVSLSDQNSAGQHGRTLHRRTKHHHPSQVAHVVTELDTLSSTSPTTAPSMKQHRSLDDVATTKTTLEGPSDVDLDEIIREMRNMSSMSMISPACSPATSKYTDTPDIHLTVTPSDATALLQHDLAVSESDEDSDADSESSSSSSSSEPDSFDPPVPTMPSDNSVSEPYGHPVNGSLANGLASSLVPEPRSSPPHEEFSWNLSQFFNTAAPVKTSPAPPPPAPLPPSNALSAPLITIHKPTSPASSISPVKPPAQPEMVDDPPSVTVKTSSVMVSKKSPKPSKSKNVESRQTAVRLKVKPIADKSQENSEKPSSKLSVAVEKSTKKSRIKKEDVSPREKAPTISRPLTPLIVPKSVLSDMTGSSITSNAVSKKRIITGRYYRSRKSTDWSLFTVNIPLDQIQRIPSKPVKVKAESLPAVEPSPAPSRKAKRKLDPEDEVPKELPVSKKAMTVPPPKKSATSSGVKETVLDSILSSGKNAKKVRKLLNGVRSIPAKPEPSVSPLPPSYSSQPPSRPVSAQKVTPPTGSAASKTLEEMWSDTQSALAALDTKMDFDHQRNLARNYKREAEQIARPSTRFAVYLQSVVHFTLMARSFEVLNKPGVSALYNSTIQMIDSSRKSFRDDESSMTLLDKVSRYLYHCVHAMLELKVYSLSEEKCTKLGRHCDYLHKHPPSTAGGPTGGGGGGGKSSSSQPVKTTLTNGKSPSPSIVATTSPYSVGSTGSHGSGEKPAVSQPANSTANNAGNSDTQSKDISLALQQALRDYHQLSLPLVSGLNHWNRSRVMIQGEGSDAVVRQFVTWLDTKAPLHLTSTVEQFSLHLYYALWVLRALKDSATT